MNEMSSSYRNYRDYRDYDNRDYRNYRDDEDYRDDGSYRDYRDYREDYRTRDYDRRGGKINNRSYRNYRGEYHEELEMALEEMRDQYRKFEDIAEMVTNPQERNMVMKVAQTEKEHYHALKQMLEK